MTGPVERWGNFREPKKMLVGNLSSFQTDDIIFSQVSAADGKPRFQVNVIASEGGLSPFSWTFHAPIDRTEDVDVDPDFAKDTSRLSGDFNGDGRVDLMWNWKSTSSSRNRLWVAYGNVDAEGTPGFDFLPSENHPIAAPWSQYSTLVADINGDGLSDIVWSLAGPFNQVLVGLGKPPSL